MPVVTDTNPSNGDNANRSLFKINQLYFASLAGAPENLAPSTGDTASISLRKINALLAAGAGGGGGGGGGTDPNAVQKTGDTMTGQLVVKGDQFDGGLTPTPIPAVLIENAAGGDAIGIALGSYGDSICIYKANGQPAHFRLGTGAVIGMYYSNGQLTIGTLGLDFNDASGFHVTLGTDGNVGKDFIVGQLMPNAGILFNGAVAGRLYFDNTTGDLMVAGVNGPSAGKSLNLTTGFISAAVQKAGDTMTGPLTIQGDQFNEGLNPGTAVPAFQIKTSASTEGFKIGQFGGLEVTGSRGEIVTRGAGFTHYDSANNRIAIGNDSAAITVNCYGGKVNISLTSDGNYLALQSVQPQTGLAFDRSGYGGPCTILAMDTTTGDLLAIATVGPNAGKSINLTNGFTSVASTGGGTIYTEFQWVPDGQSNPGYGAVSGNADTPAACTVLAVSDNDRQGVNVAGALRMLGNGGRIAGQDPANIDAWIRYNVTGASTHQSGGYTYIPVTVADQGTAPTTGWSEVNIAFSI
jgi:hypothetical protein